MTAPLEVRKAGSDRRRTLVERALIAGFGLALVVSGLVSLIARPLNHLQVITADFVILLGGWYLWRSVRWWRDYTTRRARAVVVRVDDDGVHVRQDRGGAESDATEPWWLTATWPELARAEVTLLDATSTLARIWPALPCIVRFVAERDRTEGDEHVARPAPPLWLRTEATILGLTPTQTRLARVDIAPSDGVRLRAWLAEHRPDLPVRSGPATSWVNRTTPNPWPGRPRVAIQGARHAWAGPLVTRLRPEYEAAPVALVNDEVHRRGLELLGAEVRMFDLSEQGSTELQATLHHCTAVVLQLRLTMADLDEPALLEHVELLVKVATIHLAVDRRRLVALLDPGPPETDATSLLRRRRARRTELVARALLEAAARPIASPTNPTETDSDTSDTPSPEVTVVPAHGIDPDDLAGLAAAALADGTTVGQVLRPSPYGGDMSRIAVVGGHGRVALQLLPLLLDAEHTPVALVRNEDYRAELEAAGAEVRILDLEAADADAYAEAFAGCQAVVFAAGGGADGSIERKRSVDFEGSVKSVEGARGAGITRFVQISAIGVDDDLPDDTDDVWRAYVEAKRDADAALRDSDLDWTIVRPGRLTDDDGTGQVAWGTDVERGDVPRADVAAFVVTCLDEPATIGVQANLVAGSVPILAAATNS